jgi:hypothetical protein
VDVVRDTKWLATVKMRRGAMLTELLGESTLAVPQTVEH